MNKALHITASLDQPVLLENLVEILAGGYNNTIYSKGKMPKGWQANEPSSVETYVSGNIEFDFIKKEKIRMPFITSFIYTCVKTKNSPYRITWSSSLS